MIDPEKAIEKLDEKVSSSLGFLLSFDEKLDQIKSGITLVLVIVSGILGFLIADYL